MLQVARLSPKLLGESADLVANFLRGQLNPDGGFKDRAGASDLYYSVFGMEGLIALRADLPAALIAAYLKTFGDGESLDFVHLGCLARCWANLPKEMRGGVPREGIARRIEAYRTKDGGYHAAMGQEAGTAYGCFLAMASYQDLGLPLPEGRRMLECIAGLKAEDGGYANHKDLPMGLTPATAAAVTLLRQLGEPVEPAVGEWLMARCNGGFFATPMAPMPDLLSTATALHALSGMQWDYAAVVERCLDFIDSLWTNRGAFYGNWGDDTADAEYTYYALLALGHLSV